MSNTKGKKLLDKGNRGGLSEYALAVGKDRSNISKFKKAAEVVKTWVMLPTVC